MHLRRTDWMPAAIAAAALPLTAALIGLVACSSVPLGVEGDWVWRRLAEAEPTLWGALLAALAAGGAAAGLCDRLAGARRAMAMALLFGCGFFADGIVLDGGGRAGLAENALAPLDAFTTGYLQPALEMPYRPAEAAAQVRKLLAVPPGERPAHRHVHPPANWLLADAAFRWFPGTGHFLLPETARTVDETHLWAFATPPADTPEAADAALKLVWLFWAALEIGKMLIAAAVLLTRPRRPGLALLPAVFGGGSALLFLGHFDTLYFGITAAALALFVAGVRYRRAAGTAAAGLVLGGGAFFSLGSGAPIAAGGLALAGCRRGRWRLLLGLFAGLAAAGLAGWLVFRLPPWEIALACWRNHRLFNEMAGRSFTAWLPWQLLDALLFCGPLATLMVLAAPAERVRPLKMGLTAILIGWLYLLFGGAAVGECGRLAALYLPLPLFAAGVLGGRCRVFARPLPRVLFALAALAAMVLTAVLRSRLALVVVDWGNL